MTQDERDQSERQRDLIARANRAANRPQSARIIEPSDRDAEMMERLGFTYYRNDTPVNWAALTRG